MKRIFLLALSLAPASAFAQLTAFTFLNGFSGANAVPANSSLGTGVINTLEFDASVGSFGSFTVDVDFSGLGVTSGGITGTWGLGSQSEVEDLFGGLYYVNLHTDAVPSGELRGQIVAVPEPSALGLLVAGLGLVFVAQRRRR
ncbi:MAG: CHRD domain-containing protein [Verrucomicrobiota bacterium]